MSERLKKFVNIMTKPRLKKLGVEHQNDIKISPTQILIRSVVALLTASWIGSLAVYLFVIFMRENKLFSYDFFREGLFEMYTFFIVSSIFIILMSLLFYGFLIPAKLGLTELRRDQKNTMRCITWFGFFISCAMHSILFSIAAEAQKLNILLWLMAIAIIFCIFFCSFVGHSLKKNIQDWLSPVIFVVLTALLPFGYQDVTAEVVAMGLRDFNAGGNKNILISQEGTKEPIKGKLTLLSPRNAYLKDSSGRLKIIPVTDKTTLEIW
ncbi:hypothetical protein N015_17375 [Pseudomonas asturiensis]|uniref:Uncharacterized protein n=1 Tax=Pseudomonas asturiensis TaxID=1190415 RepID=A0ABX6HEX2_9PSED|nr:hypothetical protein [Pseudomonas asturiensis]QHF04082.1 hypothetical protein N015_17375 [Pseudomonas asturiensis]